MCSIDLEPCEVWDEREVRARKSHVCSSCDGPIRAGELYVRHFSIFEGSLCSGKICDACAKDIAEFADAHGSGGCQPGYFEQLLIDCIAEGDEESDRVWSPMLERLRARGKAAA